MKNLLLTFVITFLCGMGLALIARTVWFAPDLPVSRIPSAEVPLPMVANTPPDVVEAPHGNHTPGAEDATPPGETSPKVVNQICTICGMAVDPSLPTAVYQGKTIGFGCRACPPKFAADPDKYGPHALLGKLTP